METGRRWSWRSTIFEWGVIDVEISPSGDVFMIKDSVFNSDTLQLFHSSDAGNNWIYLNVNEQVCLKPNGFCGGPYNVKVNPTGTIFSKFVIVGRGGGYSTVAISTDNGLLWSPTFITGGNAYEFSGNSVLTFGVNCDMITCWESINLSGDGGFQWYNLIDTSMACTTLNLCFNGNILSGRSVIVRVNDRGPFKHDRIIDLSYAAASKLGIAAAGTGEVEVERITMAQIASGDYRRGDGRGEPPPALAAAPGAQAATSTGTARVPAAPVAPVADAAAAGGVTAAPLAEAAPLPTSTAEVPRGWSVQLGAFTQEANAEALAGRTAALLSFLDPGALSGGSPRIEKDGTVYRVLLGVTADRSAAQALARELEKVLARPATLVLR